MATRLPQAGTGAWLCLQTSAPGLPPARRGLTWKQQSAPAPLISRRSFAVGMVPLNCAHLCIPPSLLLGVGGPQLSQGHSTVLWIQTLCPFQSQGAVGSARTMEEPFCSVVRNEPFVCDRWRL